MGQQPPGQVGGARVDGTGRRHSRNGPLGHGHDDALAALVRRGVVRVGGHLVDRQVRAAHAQWCQQAVAQAVLPPRAGEHLHGVTGRQVAEVAVLERLAQVLAEGQEAQPADQLGPGPARVAEPGHLVARQAGAVRQQVDDGQAAAHRGIVQLDLGHVVPERALPVEQAVIDEGPDRGRGEGLGGGPDGEQGVRGDWALGIQVTLPPSGGQHDSAILDGDDSAARDLPGGQLVDDEPFDALHVASNGRARSAGRPRRGWRGAGRGAARSSGR
jgi:hypothetical protein